MGNPNDMNSNKLIAVIRLRGTVGIKPNAKRTMESLNLNRKFSCVILPDTDINTGMLQAAHDYIAFGKINDESLLKLLIEKRGKTIMGHKKLEGNDLDAAFESLRSGTGVPTGVRKVFHLHPPTKGFKGRGIKTARTQKGNLGRWADGAIEELLRRMI
jgi:large subunit ribosomal protein L30